MNNSFTRLFFDKSKDEFSRSTNNRLTGGVTVDWKLSDYNSINIDFQAQETQLTYEYAPSKDTYVDIYGSISFSQSPKYSVAFEIQRTGDPEVTDNIGTKKYEIDPRTLWAINLNYQINDEHELLIFYGERRGGPACTAGTCYEVLPFKGLEFRIVSRF